MKIQRKRITITRTFTKRRQIVSQWSYQLTVKRQSTTETCALASRTRTGDRQRFIDDCNRLKSEVTELQTQISVESEKVEQEEHIAQEESSREEQIIEHEKITSEIRVEQKSEQEKVEVEETTTTKEVEAMEEKETLITQRSELQRLQEKTSTRIEVSIRNEQKSVNFLIRNLRRRMRKLVRKSEEISGELGDDSEERTKVTTNIQKRAETTITKITTVTTTLKTKVTKIVTGITTQRTTLTTTQTKITEITIQIRTVKEKWYELGRDYKNKIAIYRRNTKSTSVTESILIEIKKKMKDYKKEAFDLIK